MELFNYGKGSYTEVLLPTRTKRTAIGLQKENIAMSLNRCKLRNSNPKQKIMKNPMVDLWTLKYA